MFYFGYSGNKRKELRELDDLLTKIEYKKVVEPFGGSCAFSYDQYTKNNNLEIHISDIDHDLTFFCNNFHKCDNDVLNNVLKYIKDINNKEEYDIFYKKCLQKTKDKNDILSFCSHYLFIKTCYNMRHGLYYDKKLPKMININKVKENLNNFFKKNIYHNRHYKEVFDQFIDDKDAIIFLDPPYVNSTCSFYDKFDDTDFTLLWEDIYNLLDKAKCKVVLVVNDNFFMKKCYNKWLYKSYDKKYSFNKSKKTIHNVFTNI